MAKPQKSEKAASSWLALYAALQAKYDASIIRQLEEAAATVDRSIKRIAGKQGVGAEVRSFQLLQAKRSINDTLAKFWRGIGSTTRAGRLEAQSLAIEKSFKWDEALLKSVVPDAAERETIKSLLASSAPKNIDAMVVRILGPHLSLAKSVYHAKALSDGQVSNAINSALARGATVRELAQDVVGLIKPTTPGGVSYASLRVARTEINNAYHAQSVQSAIGKPWVTGMRWHLSGSHPTPDLCNVYAENDRGQGKGVFTVEGVPAKPHPQCLCYVVPELMSIKAFNQSLVFGDFDRWMDDLKNPGLGSPGKSA